MFSRGTFALRVEKTLEICFVFVCHCDVFFNAAQERCLFV